MSDPFLRPRPARRPTRPRERIARAHAARALAAVAACGAVALAGCSSGDPQQAPSNGTAQELTLTTAQQRSIRVYTVEPANYRASITTNATVDFDRNRAAAVLAPFSGPVTRLLVTLGAHVRRDQALAWVSSPDFTTEVGAYRKAIAAARAADAIAANDRVLYVHRAISERENAAAEAAAIGANEDRAAALQALEALHIDPRTIADIRAGKLPARGEGVIRAPIAGTVVSKSIAPGETLAAGSTPCFTIADTSRMWVMAQLFGSEVTEVSPGDSAEVDGSDGAKPLAGTVTHIGAVVDPVTRAVTARVRVDNPADLLKKGQYVDVRIASRRQQTGLLIPVSAVLRDDENLPFVYIAEPQGRYARRSVSLGSRIGNRFVVPEGLHSGDEVVVDGSIFLRFIQSQ